MFMTRYHDRYERALYKKSCVVGQESVGGALGFDPQAVSLMSLVVLPPLAWALGDL